MATIENITYNSYPVIADGLIVKGIVDYFNSLNKLNPLINALQNNIFDYSRGDVYAEAYPVLSIYPKTTDDKYQLGYRTGTIMFELQIPISQDRSRLTETYYVLTRQLIEIIRHEDIIKFLSNYLPPNCLRKFAFDDRNINNDDLYSKKDRREYKFLTSITYEFSMLAYDNYLIKMGYDPINTNIQSNIVSGTDLEVIVITGG